jgi:hypothetical protein
MNKTVVLVCALGLSSCKFGEGKTDWRIQVLTDHSNLISIEIKGERKSPTLTYNKHEGTGFCYSDVDDKRFIDQDCRFFERAMKTLIANDPEAAAQFKKAVEPSAGGMKKLFNIFKGDETESKEK